MVFWEFYGCVAWENSTMALLFFVLLQILFSLIIK